MDDGGGSAGQGDDEWTLAREAELREHLQRDPNDVAAFNELAEIVRRHGANARVADPLTGDQPHEHRSGEDLAVWALAEDLAGQPKAWFPLIELARLSVDRDIEGATRRLNAAAEREDTGLALAEALWVLRESGQPSTGHGLAVAHWRPAEHVPAAGRQVVLSALEAGREETARRHLETMREVEGSEEVVTELDALFAERDAEADGAEADGAGEEGRDERPSSGDTA